MHPEEQTALWDDAAVGGLGHRRERVRLPLLTNSQQKTYRRCAREHFYAYVLGYRSAHEVEALHYGDLVHMGLEAWWSASIDALESALPAMRPHAVDEYELARAEIMLRGYDVMWCVEREHYEVLAVEHEFRAPLINPETGAQSRTFELGGKLDVIVRDTRDGLVKLIEHKTTSDDIGAGSDYWLALQLDSQISTYFAGARAVGFDIAECIYDVLGKPSLRPYKATPPESRKYTKEGRLYANQREHDETAQEYKLRLAEHVADNPRRYYQRGTVVRLEQEEVDAAHDAWQTAQAIKDALRLNRWPRNADACRRFGKRCPFFDVCCRIATLDDETRYRKVENVHEELATEDSRAA
jgi:hypothetical protein